MVIQIQRHELLNKKNRIKFLCTSNYLLGKAHTLSASSTHILRIGKLRTEDWRECRPTWKIKTFSPKILCNTNAFSHICRRSKQFNMYIALKLFYSLVEVLLIWKMSFFCYDYAFLNKIMGGKNPTTQIFFENFED